MRFPLFQEQIAACHEFDGVRKEKERLTAAYWSRELQLHLTDLFFTGIKPKDIRIIPQGLTLV